MAAGTRPIQQAVGAVSGDDALRDRGELLWDLERSIKGRLFYAPGHRAQQIFTRRCWRSWRRELGRSGGFSIEVRRGEFHFGDGGRAVGQPGLRQLARRFRLRALARVTFRPGLDEPSLLALIDALAAPPEQVEAAGGVSARLRAGPHRGIAVEAVDYAAHARRAGGEGSERHDAAPPRLAGESFPFPAAGGGTASDPRWGDLWRRLDGGREGQGEGEGDWDWALGGAAGAAASAADFPIGPAWELLTRLTHHADADGSGGSDAAGRAAGGRLGAALEMACAPDHRAALDAMGTLLELGPAVLAPLFERWEGAGRAADRIQLGGILVAIGEGVAPALERAIRDEASPRRRIALRFAGETQNGRLVPCLRDALLAGGDDQVRDAASALSRIGNGAAFEVLVGALRSPRAEVVMAAVACLGRSGRPRFAAPLLRALEVALLRGSVGVAREIVRALGRVGGGAAATVTALGDLVAGAGGGGLWRRRRLRPVRLAAVSSLAALADARVADILGRAAQGSDAPLRRAARSARAALAARAPQRSAPAVAAEPTDRALENSP